MYVYDYFEGKETCPCCKSKEVSLNKYRKKIKVTDEEKKRISETYGYSKERDRNYGYIQHNNYLAVCCNNCGRGNPYGLTSVTIKYKRYNQEKVAKRYTDRGKKQYVDFKIEEKTTEDIVKDMLITKR